MISRSIIVIFAILDVAHSSITMKANLISDEVRHDSERIIKYLTNGNGQSLAYNRLAYLTDKYGDRLTGGLGLTRASNYLVDVSTKEGFRAYTEKAIVPGWIRGTERAYMLKPRKQELAIMGLGFTIPTPANGITAGVVVVSSQEELQKLGRRVVRGKIVVFNQPWLNYRQSVKYRLNGASYAAQLGGVGALVRSAASFSINSPHTGRMSYQINITKVPVASISTEDAEMLHRLYKRGTKIEIMLRIDSHPIGDVQSRNTIVEMKGSMYPNEIIIISGHLDSWDVSSGAMDDGGGVIIAWTALSALKALGLRPKRTIRAIFWTGEEQGHVGSKQYYDYHKSLNETFVFVSQSDFGAFKPDGLNFTGSKIATDKMRNIINLLKPINANRIFPLSFGGDVQHWIDDGIPGACMITTSKYDYYFMFHHSKGDNIMVFKPEDLDMASTLFAVVSYAVAQLDEPLSAN